MRNQHGNFRHTKKQKKKTKTDINAKHSNSTTQHKTTEDNATKRRFVYLNFTIRFKLTLMFKMAKCKTGCRPSQNNSKNLKMKKFQQVALKRRQAFQKTQCTKYKKYVKKQCHTAAATFGYDEELFKEAVV